MPAAAAPGARWEVGGHRQQPRSKPHCQGPLRVLSLPLLAPKPPPADRPAPAAWPALRLLADVAMAGWFSLSLGAWLPSAAPDHARAGGHGARDQSDPLAPTGRRGGGWPNDGEVDVGGCRRFRLTIDIAGRTSRVLLLSLIPRGNPVRGRTLELGRSERTIMPAAAAPGARWEVGGHRQQPRSKPHCQGPLRVLSLPLLAPKPPPADRPAPAAWPALRLLADVAMAGWFSLSLGAWVPSAAPDHARAGGHGARDQSDPLEPTGRRGGGWPNDGEVDVGGCRRFRLTIDIAGRTSRVLLLSLIPRGNPVRGRTLELGRSERTIMPAAAAPGARWEVGGHRQQPRSKPHCQGPLRVLSLPLLAPKPPPADRPAPAAWPALRLLADVAMAGWFSLSLGAWLPSAAPDHARAGGHGARDQSDPLAPTGRRGGGWPNDGEVDVGGCRRFRLTIDIAGRTSRVLLLSLIPARQSSSGANAGARAFGANDHAGRRGAGRAGFKQ